jgi:hypothetical protein
MEGNMQKNAKQLGEILVERGCITEAQLQEALMEQRLGDKKLGDILVERRAVSGADLAKAIAQQFGMNFVEFKAQHLDFELARRFSSSLIIDQRCFPLREDEFTVTVAIVNPLDGVALSALAEEARPKTVSLVVVTDEDMKTVLQSYRQFLSLSIQRMLKKKRIQGIGGTEPPVQE